MQSSSSQRSSMNYFTNSSVINIPPSIIIIVHHLKMIISQEQFPTSNLPTYLPGQYLRIMRDKLNSDDNKQNDTEYKELISLFVPLEITLRMMNEMRLNITTSGIFELFRKVYFVVNEREKMNTINRMLNEDYSGATN